MTSHFAALCFDANDPFRLARFWAGVLGREVADDPGGFVLPPTDDAEFPIRFLPAEEQKTLQNRTHFDLTSASQEEMDRTVARALELGGRHIDIGQTPDDGHVVLADPDGNEFCVIEPGNNFLAGCGFIGAVNGDGTREGGYFWSEALGWPLVWDQDEETAIQSPRGGAKFTWSGPPLLAKPRKNRLHFDLAPVGGDPQAEVDRLASLGATRIDIGPSRRSLRSLLSNQHGEVDWVVMADPDDNEFCVLASHEVR